MYSLTDNYMNEHNACDFTLITLSCTHWIYEYWLGLSFGICVSINTPF